MIHKLSVYKATPHEAHLRYTVHGTPLFRTPLGPAASSVLIKGDVLISGGVLYTALCNWDSAWCPD